jgi:hypothetical protein
LYLIYLIKHFVGLSFIQQPVHVLGVFIPHHQEVFTVYVHQLVRVICLSWCTNCCWGKALSIAYSKCVFVTLVIQHAKCMYHILSSVVCPAVHYFFNSLINSTIFREKSYKTWNVCFDCLYNFCLIYFSFEKNSARYCHKCMQASCKVPVIPVRFYWNMNVLDRFSNITQISSFMTIRPVEATFFHADGQTDMTKLLFAFRNFFKHA